MSKFNLDYKPIEFVRTDNLTREQWLAYRKKGIGGSDAAAAMYLSPFQTCRELYYDKISDVLEPESEYVSNWVQFKVGNLLEDLVAEIFAKQTGYKVFKVKIMFQHPLYPFMLADIDFMVELPDGTYAILECKTSSLHNMYKWANGAIPIHVEIQKRHYMAVLNIHQAFSACLFSNTEESFVKRYIKRDLAKEREMIFFENELWNYHVLRRQEPPIFEGAKLAERYFAESAKALQMKPETMLDKEYEQNLKKYLHLKERKALLDKIKRNITSQMDTLAMPIIDKVSKAHKGYLQTDTHIYSASYDISGRPTIKKDQLELMKIQHPEVYEKYVTYSNSRSLKITSKENTATHQIAVA